MQVVSRLYSLVGVVQISSTTVVVLCPVGGYHSLNGSGVLVVNFLIASYTMRVHSMGWVPLFYIVSSNQAPVRCTNVVHIATAM